MKSLKMSAFVAILAVFAMIGLHGVGRAQTTNLRILSPAQGAKLTDDIIRISYELINPAVAGSPSPTFQIQLDGQDPVQTTENDYTFTGLPAGPHTIVVELVDANGTPIAGSANAVQFVVLPVQPKPQSALEQLSGPGTPQPTAFSAGGAPLKASLPEAASPLPLLSVIGFGVLLGGIVSAMRTH